MNNYHNYLFLQLSSYNKFPFSLFRNFFNHCCKRSFLKIILTLFLKFLKKFFTPISNIRRSLCKGIHSIFRPTFLFPWKDFLKNLFNRSQSLTFRSLPVSSKTKIFVKKLHPPPWMFVISWKSRIQSGNRPIPIVKFSSQQYDTASSL